MLFALYELKTGQSVGINGDAYTVCGMAEFRQGTYLWKEYMLERAPGQRFWLSVAQDERISVCGLYREADAVFPAEPELIHDGKGYVLAASGRAEVLECFGLDGVEAGGIVWYWEYRSESGLLLSRKQWGNIIECASGTEVPRAGIGPWWNKIRNLPLGQELEIEREKYRVMGCVNIEQRNSQWVEYDLEPGAGPRACLSTEPSSDGGCVLSLHRPILRRNLRYQEGYSQALWQGEVYERVEQDTGSVTGFRGRGSYYDDKLVRYSEYRSPSGKILTLETWVSRGAGGGLFNVKEEDETFAGRVLNHADVKILNDCQLSAQAFSEAPNHARESANIPDLPPGRGYEYRWGNLLFWLLLNGFLLVYYIAVRYGL